MNVVVQREKYFANWKMCIVQGTVGIGILSVNNFCQQKDIVL